MFVAGKAEDPGLVQDHHHIGEAGQDDAGVAEGKIRKGLADPVGIAGQDRARLEMQLGRFRGMHRGVRQYGRREISQKIHPMLLFL